MFAGCSQGTQPSVATGSKLQVVTTLFPLYDMARAIGGTYADVRLLVPPGVEPHNFEPRPDDIMTINRSGLFIFTNRFMEPWAEKMIRAVDIGRIKVVDASAGLQLRPPDFSGRHEHAHEDSGGHGSNHAEKGLDPHVWLDLANAVRMLDTIRVSIVEKDPAHRAYYETNAAVYRKKLEDLDRQFSATLGVCSNRTLLHAGHYAFGYLAGRYGLDYVAATGVSADSEPTPARLAGLVKQVRTLGIKVVFSEELVSPKLAETIAGETGAGIVKLHAGHNISREELARGITFPELMEQNLDALAKGLQCPR